MKKADIERLANHVRGMNALNGGYPYPEWKTEKEWAEANLPKTAKELSAVVECIRTAGWMVLEDEVIKILGKGCFIPKPKKAKAKGASAHFCVRCGTPAYSRANFGWACANHYDSLS